MRESYFLFLSMKKILITLASLSLILTACSLRQKHEPVPIPIDIPVHTPATGKSYTTEEVAGHNTGASCWLILDKKVYDVTSFIPKHPGGEAILRGCGKDATQMFAGHSASAKAMKEQFYIGDLK
jgi:cytochrome b involved in lipid metabolism